MVRVVEFREPGKPEVLQMGERPRQLVNGDQVRVRVAFSGLNRADLSRRLGRYPAPPGFPQDIPGIEYAGEIVEVGVDCRLRSAGDLVMGIIGGGGYSEELVVPEQQTIRVPAGLTLEAAGAIPEAFVTAWDALILQANLEAGETALIHAVGSGVGTAGLQLARAWGARTVGTSRTQSKLDRARALGLDHGILAEDARAWAPRVREAIGEAGVDVVLDLVGGAYVEGNLDVLGKHGRWIVVGVTGGRSGTLDLRGLMAKRAMIRGTVLGARSADEKAHLAKEFDRRVVPLFEEGKLLPVVDQVIAPEAAAAAHRSLEANESFGKILLAWGTKEAHLRTRPPEGAR